jgi:hypothetical protein
MNNFNINPNKYIEIAAVAPRPVLMCPGQRVETIADDLARLSMCYGIEVIRAGKGLLQYRGVALNRLPTILRTGVDTEPTHGVFWSSDRIGKALEYGGRDKVVLVLDPRRLRPASLLASEYHGGIGYDHYAHWIPDDPFDALLLAIAVAPPECPLVSEVLRMISECSETKWKTGTAEEQAAVLTRATDTRRLTLND